MKKIALIVGHSETSGGANNYLGENEYSFNSRIATKIVEICQKKHQSLFDIAVFQRRSGSYSLLLPEIRLYKPDASIELHFNSFFTKAYGVEMLIYEKALDIDNLAILADKITDAFAAEYGVKERRTYTMSDSRVIDGVKVMTDGRGAANLKLIHSCGVPYVMLFEPVFGNFLTDESRAIFQDEARYIDFFVNVLSKVVIDHI